MATPSTILAWRIPWMEEPGGLPVHGVTKSWTRLSDFIYLLKNGFEKLIAVTVYKTD